MTWFVVSIISVIQASEDKQDEYPVYEDFFLFSANSEEELQRKISDRMNIIESGGDCQYKGINAKQICLGVRKIRSIYNEPPRHIDKDPPADATELTHSFMIVQSLPEAKQLADGKSITLRYVDDDDD